jgi:hypothetical protein
MYKIKHNTRVSKLCVLYVLSLVWKSEGFNSINLELYTAMYLFIICILYICIFDLFMQLCCFIGQISIALILLHKITVPLCSGVLVVSNVTRNNNKIVHVRFTSVYLQAIGTSTGTIPVLLRVLLRNSEALGNCSNKVFDLRSHFIVSISIAQTWCSLIL